MFFGNRRLAVRDGVTVDQPPPLRSGERTGDQTGHVPHGLRAQRPSLFGLAVMPTTLQEPVPFAIEMDTAVTAQNSAALATLTAILAGAMGLAPPAIAAPAGIGGLSLPAISTPAPSVSIPSIIFGGGSRNAGGAGGYGVGETGGGASLNDLFNLPSTSVLGINGIGPGGTSGYAGPVGAFGSSTHASSGGGFNPLSMILGGGGTRAGAGGGGGLSGVLGNLKSTNWGGFNRAPTSWAQDDDGSYSQRGGGQITGVNGVAGAALGAGGMMLAQQGLLGSSRGTWGGVAEGTAGGASIGYQQGGALGAAIGGGAGLLIGLGEKLAGVETPVNQVKRLCKQLYGVSVDTAMANQIVGIAQSKYSNHIDIAVRDPDVRKMLELYAQGTGQKMPLSATTPQAGILAESGGKLYQQASYVNGAAYTYQSSLPVLGGLSSGTYPTSGGPNTAAGAGPVNLSLNIEGADTASFLTGQVVTPSYVADASMAAQNASYGRVQQAANTQVPGLVTGT